MMLKPNLLVKLLILFAIPNICFGIKDEDQPLQITSDTAEFDDLSGKAVHKGNVVLTQGSRKVTSDRLIIERGKDNKIKMIIAIGSPAKFRSQPDTNKPEGKGQASKIIYYPVDNKVNLIENAKLIQNNDIISGPNLVYYFEKRILISKPVAGNRTTVTIQPKG